MLHVSSLLATLIRPGMRDPLLLLSGSGLELLAVSSSVVALAALVLAGYTWSRWDRRHGPALAQARAAELVERLRLLDVERSHEQLLTRALERARPLPAGYDPPPTAADVCRSALRVRALSLSLGTLPGPALKEYEAWQLRRKFGTSLEAELRLASIRAELEASAALIVL